MQEFLCSGDEVAFGRVAGGGVVLFELVREGAADYLSYLGRSVVVFRPGLGLPTESISMQSHPNNIITYPFPSRQATYLKQIPRAIH